MKWTIIILLIFLFGCRERREYHDSDLQVCIVNDEMREGGLLYGFKDRWGDVVIEPQFVDVQDFSEGLALVRDQSLLWGFVDYYGNPVIPPRFLKAESFHDGFAPVADSSGKWGYIDQKGKYLLVPQFERAYSFMSGCAVVNKGAHDPKHIKRDIGGLFGMIDRTGKITE